MSDAQPGQSQLSIPMHSSAEDGHPAASGAAAPDSYLLEDSDCLMWMEKDGAGISPACQDTMCPAADVPH